MAKLLTWTSRSGACWMASINWRLPRAPWLLPWEITVRAWANTAKQTHGIFLYDATLHVPLIVAGPDVPRGKVISDQVGPSTFTPR